eukprot:1156355-Pelagomonas_calceolata.AAC.9
MQGQQVPQESEKQSTEKEHSNMVQAAFGECEKQSMENKTGMSPGCVSYGAATWVQAAFGKFAKQGIEQTAQIACYDSFLFGASGLQHGAAYPFRD